MIENFSFFGATDMGRVRTNNEDTFVCQTVWDADHLLCVAIDGVGGYDGGEVAAEMARSTIVDYVNRYPAPDDACLDVLKQAVVEANNAIVQQKRAEGQYPHMSCVLTAGLFDIARMQLNVVHVGDTRLYQYAGGELRKLTHDHSLVGFREEQGELTEEEAMRHPQRNLIERCVGEEMHMLDDRNFMESGIFPMPANAHFVFCTDGLTDMVTSGDIRRVLDTEGSVERRAHQLIAAANDRGGRDNVTVVVVETKGTDDAVADATHPTAVATAAETDVPQPASSSCRRRRRGLPLLLCLLVGVAVGAGGASWWWQRYCDGRQQTHDNIVKELNTKMQWQERTITELQETNVQLTDSINKLQTE